MGDALIALHFQNDICHGNGLIPFSRDRSGAEPLVFLDTSRRLIDGARRAGWLIVHVHMAFEDDYSDLPGNCRLFKAVEPLGALKRGSWGAAPMGGFDHEPGDVSLIHNRNNGFHETGLDELLRERGVERVCVIGLATQFSVEHTVRHAADLGYHVVVARDCCMSADADAQAASFKTMSFLADVVESGEIAL